MGFLNKYKAFAYLLTIVLSAHMAAAQLGGIKKLGTKVKDVAVGGATGVAAGMSGKRGEDKSNNVQESATGGAQIKVKDGEAAVIATAMSAASALSKVKDYFNNKDVDFTVNADTARLVTDWYGERRCGPGFNRCANKAMVRVATEDGKTIVRIQVIERKRETGLSDRPWRENTNSKGKETSELAEKLRTLLEDRP